jgi:hypothetical protein
VDTSATASPAVTGAEEASSGPVDDPSVPRADAAGRSPSGVVLELIDALNARDWTSAYAQYAQPYVEYAQAVKDWKAANEQYEHFAVLETRVERDDLAFVRARYTVHYNGPDRKRLTVTVDDPEAWWAVDKVGGRWKTRWMPAQ